MHKVRITLISALLLGATSFAFAAEPDKKAEAPAEEKVASSDNPTHNPPGYKKDEVVCRRERVTGSRFARNLCHSREEWERMRKAGIEGTDNVQRAPIPIINN